MIGNRTTFCCVVASFALLSCGTGDQEELRQWMKEETKDLRGKIPPLPAVSTYQPVPYDAAGMIDPFKPSKIRLEAKSTNGLQPDMNRPRQPLESYPLESLKYVGILSQGRQNFAIIHAEGALHQVKIGGYLGQNFGVVTKISETELSLKELVQDPVGDWVERVSTMQLQAQPKEGK